MADSNSARYARVRSSWLLRWRTRSRLLIRQSSSTLFTGLVRKSSVPAWTPRSKSDASFSAVTIRMRRSLVAGLARSLRQTSKPESRGIITSSRSRSGANSSTTRRVSSPSKAVRISQSTSLRYASSSSTFWRLSSAITIFGGPFGRSKAGSPGSETDRPRPFPEIARREGRAGADAGEDGSLRRSILTATAAPPEPESLTTICPRNRRPESARPLRHDCSMRCQVCDDCRLPPAIEDGKIVNNGVAST